MLVVIRMQRAGSRASSADAHTSMPYNHDWLHLLDQWFHHVKVRPFSFVLAPAGTLPASSTTRYALSFVRRNARSPRMSLQHQLTIAAAAFPLACPPTTRTRALGWLACNGSVTTDQHPCLPRPVLPRALPAAPPPAQGGGSRTPATDIIPPMYARPSQIKVRTQSSSLQPLGVRSPGIQGSAAVPIHVRAYQGNALQNVPVARRAIGYPPHTTLVLGTLSAVS